MTTQQSNKSSTADLLVKVRYQNPLAPPPFPPRLLHIATDPSRYSDYDFLNPLHQQQPLPIILDAELGLPVQLGSTSHYSALPAGEYWNIAQAETRALFCPTGPPPLPQEEDLFLLGDVAAALSLPSASSSSSSAPATAVAASSSMMGERKDPKVSWLRRTEYLSSEAGAGRGVSSATSSGSITPKSAAAAAASKPISLLPTLTPREAIELSFAIAAKPLQQLQHPTKQNLVAVEAWDVLPHVELWPSDLALLRFGEDPGEENVIGAKAAARTSPDPRLTNALFRSLDFPVEGTRLAYYLPEDDQTARMYEKRRRAGVLPPASELSYEFRHVRDYHIASSRALESEFIFTFDNGDDDDDEGAGAGEGEADEEKQEGKDRKRKRARGAFFAPLAGATTLRKRRPRPNEDATVYPAAMKASHWHGLAVSVSGIDELEHEERRERQAFMDEVSLPPLDL